MAERDYGRDRNERDLDWRNEDRDRDENRNRWDRDDRRFGREDRPVSGYGMEGYGPERYRENAGRWGSESERDENRRREWRLRRDDQWRSSSQEGGRDWGRPPSEGDYRRSGYSSRSYQGGSVGYGGGQSGYGSGYTSGQGYGSGEGGGYGEGGYRSGEGGYGGGYGTRGEGYGQSGWRERMVRPPRNYVRTDERIREDVCEAIVRAGDIDAGDVDIVVQDAEVTLSGFVDERDDKRRIEYLAEDVPGVREVHNQIRTKPRGSFREALSRTGEAIKQFVKGEPATGQSSSSESNLSSTTSNQRNNATTVNPPTR